MSNKKIISLSLFIIIGMIIVTTIYKIYNEHNNNRILVVEKEFAYYAKACYNDDKCKNKIVYLKDLYEAEIYKKQRLEEILKKIQVDKVEINKLFLSNF